MLTYRLQQMVFKFDRRPAFPARCTARIRLSRVAGLGFDAPGRTAVVGADLRLIHSSYSGKSLVKSQPPLESPRVTLSHKDGEAVSLSGNELTIAWQRVSSLEELERRINTYRLFVPALFSLPLLDPVVVTHVSGTAGGIPFEFVMARSNGPFKAVTVELLERELGRALLRARVVAAEPTRRLAAALGYFHSACRLLSVGASTWEFMSEAVLDMNKALEALFSKTRMSDTSHTDAVRELNRLGFDSAKTQLLKSVMILRDHLDSAHVDTWIHKPGHLEAVYRMLEAAESDMRHLFEFLITEIEKDSYQLPKGWEPEPSKDVLEMLAFIVDEYGGEPVDPPPNPLLNATMSPRIEQFRHPGAKGAGR